MANLAGKTERDTKIWNTYVFWARLALDPKTPSKANLHIANARRRLTANQDAALRGIVFTAFALEYRIKRIFEDLHLSYRARDTLGVLLGVFRQRVETAARMDNGKTIKLPNEWQPLEARLKKVNELRNTIAHANYSLVHHILTDRPGRVAGRAFNAFVDFIQVTNRAIGYDTRAPADSRADYHSLKVRVP